MSIFCIGQSAYDITFPVDETIVENRKYRLNERFECGGAPAFNAACLCALWKADVSLISRIGNDTYGDRLKEDLKKRNVCLDHLIRDDKVETPYSYIFTNNENGSRTIFNYPGTLGKVNYEFPNQTPDVILSDGHEPDISIAAMERYPDAVSLVDAGTCRDSTLAVAKNVDWLVCSEDFARQYTGEAVSLSDMDRAEILFGEMKKINGKYAVITLGEKGLLYEMNGMLCHLPAYRVKAVDTTGAGDIFHGAFAYGLEKQLPLVDILRISSMASAISVETVGSQSSIPELSTVEQRLKESE